MADKIRVDNLKPEIAEAVWAESPQATAFSHPRVLTACADEVDWWGAWRSDDLVAAWPVCRPYGGNFRNPIFCYYVGPMFNHEIQTFKYHRRWAIRQQALEALIPHLVDRYGAFNFSLAPGEIDIRAFEWWNHDHPGRPRFDLHPRHTAMIHHLDRDPESIRQDFARNRKRDIRLSGDGLPDSSVTWSIGEIIALHDEPMERQNQIIPPERTLALERLLNIAKAGMGQILVWRDPEDGALASVIVMLYGKQEANNVLCVAAEKWRNRGLAAWTTWQGILQAREEGKRVFDFNGANSPSRAADKHAYGAVASLYFNIRCK